MWGLANATANRVYMGADMRPLTGGVGRRSVRIQSNTVYNAGLFIVRLDHMPTGCGTWPAMWMYGEDANHVWPKWGEYDIIEGVHTMDSVMTSLHTTPHCDQSAVAERMDFMLKWRHGESGGPADSCSILEPDQFHNQGCSQRGPDGSVGANFNAMGGGTYAAEWDPVAQYFRTWFFRAGAEPPDLALGTPLPENWGTPYSYFSLAPQTCSPRHFVNMRLVFDLTFCGDLGGPTFAKYCPDFAERMTCEEFVENNPEAMREAYWSIRAMDVYQRASNFFTPVSLLPAERDSPPAQGSSWLAILGYTLLFLMFATVTVVYAVVWRKVNVQPMDTGTCSTLCGVRRRMGSPLDYEEGIAGTGGASDDVLSLLFSAGSWASSMVPATPTLADPYLVPEGGDMRMPAAPRTPIKGVVAQPAKNYH